MGLTDMNYNCLDLEQRGPVLRVTLNRPQVLNALNLELVDELGFLFAGRYTREDIRVVVMRGAGRAFCA